MIDQSLNIVSPCIGVCKLGRDNYCLGCLRTVDEIRDWKNSSRDEQLAILGLLKDRRRANGLIGMGALRHKRRRG